MPLQRRLPKIGFSSAMKASRAELTLDDLMRVKGGEVTLQVLIDANLVPEYTKIVKIILSGALTKAYAVKDKTITATKGAKTAVEAAGRSFPPHRGPARTPATRTHAATALAGLTPPAAT